MNDLPVSDAEKERLLAEIGVEPSSVMIPAAPPPLPVLSPPPAPAPPTRTVEDVDVPPPAPPEPRRPSRVWARRRALAAAVMLSAGSAWLSMWMVSERPAAAGLAALGIVAGTWVLLRPKKS